MSEYSNSVNPVYDPGEMDEIDLFDLFFYVLRKYRVIIASGLILLVIFGAVGALKEKKELSREYENRVQEYEKNYRAYEVAVTAWEARTASYDDMLFNIESVNKLMEGKKEYLKNSIYLNLDSSNVAEAVTCWSVRPEDSEYEKGGGGMRDPADDIGNLYCLSLKPAIDWISIGKEMGIDPVYVQELVIPLYDLDGNFITITACSKDLKDAERLRDLVNAQAEEIWKDMAPSLPAHSLNKVVERSGMTIDPLIDEQRKLQTDILSSYGDRISALSRNLDATANPYESGDEPVEPVMPEPPGSNIKDIVKSGIKFGGIGFLAGVFLTMGFFGAAYIVSGKIHTADELKDYYRLEVFTGIGADKEQKTGNPLDRLLDRLSGKREIDRDSALKRLAIRLERLSEKDSIIVTGTVPFEELKEVKEGLAGLLSGKTLTPAESILVDNGTLGLTGEGSEVLLVEKKNSSKKKEISEELHILREQRGKVLGAVLLD